MDTWLFLSCFTIGQVPRLHRGGRKCPSLLLGEPESHAVVTMVF